MQINEYTTGEAAFETHVSTFSEQDRFPFGFMRHVGSKFSQKTRILPFIDYT